MDFLAFLQAIVQGIVQGITEWLPISSTGHLILLNTFWPMDKAFFDVFKVVIQLGSILAVLVLFFHKLNPFSSKKTAIERKSTFSLWGKVLVASVPAGIVGVLFNDQIDSISVAPLIAGMLILYGVLFIWLEMQHRKARFNQLSDVSYRTALFIGAFQMLALVPGTSRSGATILGAVFLGCSRLVAAEFSFFMAIPVMFGASGVKVLKFLGDGLTFTGMQWVMLLAGTLTAFVVSLLVIRFFMNFIKKHDFKVFGYYRIVLGLVVLALCVFQVIGWGEIFE